MIEKLNDNDIRILIMKKTMTFGLHLIERFYLYKFKNMYYKNHKFYEF